jgi:hypothetical protein
MSPFRLDFRALSSRRFRGGKMDETKVRACREQVRRYREMSRAAMTPELERMFTELAEGWSFLANEIEQTLAKEHNKT